MKEHKKHIRRLKKKIIYLPLCKCQNSIKVHPNTEPNHHHSWKDQCKVRRTCYLIQKFCNWLIYRCCTLSPKNDRAPKYNTCSHHLSVGLWALLVRLMMAPKTRELSLKELRQSDVTGWWSEWGLSHRFLFDKEIQSHVCISSLSSELRIHFGQNSVCKSMTQVNSSSELLELNGLRLCKFNFR